MNISISSWTYSRSSAISCNDFVLIEAKVFASLLESALLSFRTVPCRLLFTLTTVLSKLACSWKDTSKDTSKINKIDLMRYPSHPVFAYSLLSNASNVSWRQVQLPFQFLSHPLWPRSQTGSSLLVQQSLISKSLGALYQYWRYQRDASL